MSGTLIKVGDHWQTRYGDVAVVHCNDGDSDYPFNVRIVGHTYPVGCDEYAFSVDAAGREYKHRKSGHDLMHRVPAPAGSVTRGGEAMLLPTDAAERKGMPITTGVLDYFPLALAEVAKLSKAGNDQHNPGQPLHWDKSKSTDHADTLARHLIDRGRLDSDGQRHSAKLAWRALALLQTELEAERE